MATSSSSLRASEAPTSVSPNGSSAAGRNGTLAGNGTAGSSSAPRTDDHAPSDRGPSDNLPLASFSMPSEAPTARRTASLSSSSLLVTRGDAHAQAALAACARTDANLGMLLRTIQQLAAGVSAAQASKEDVAQEIEHLRALLGYADEQQLSLRQQNAALEQALEEAVARVQGEAARDRAFLIEQQDTFIASLIEEHEQTLGELRNRMRAAEADLQRYSEDRRTQASTVRAATATTFELTQKLGAAEHALARSQNERSHWQAECERQERDNRELRAELEKLRAGALEAPKSRAPGAIEAAPTLPESSVTLPSVVSSAPSSSGVPLAAVRLESRRAGVRPEDLGIRTEPLLTPAAGTTKPPLKSKPDASTRPLIGYSLVGEELREELIESSRGRPTPR